MWSGDGDHTDSQKIFYIVGGTRLERIYKRRKSWSGKKLTYILQAEVHVSAGVKAMSCAPKYGRSDVSPLAGNPPFGSYHTCGPLPGHHPLAYGGGPDGSIGCICCQQRQPCSFRIELPIHWTAIGETVSCCGAFTAPRPAHEKDTRKGSERNIE
jgi:hypothetical protein